ncbi:RibD family protein [Litorimonas haliclonae]|uniref:RibD family protein n=1 Tax=Litorimonas haliclonae TaxID=2081977 RepID=UPI0039F07317
MHRPLITLKLATSLDGKIALANGQSEWITGEVARKEGRKLRARHDAIAVGSNTAVTDNPQLTTRITGEPDPVRVIFDSQLRVSPDSNLAQTAFETPTYILTRSDEGNAAMKLKDLGVQLIVVPYEKGLSLPHALDSLFNLGIRTLLLEGGGTLAASFLRESLVDTIEWFRAPVILGAEARPAIGDLGLTNINAIYRFERTDLNEVGSDIWERYALKSAD